MHVAVGDRQVAPLHRVEAELLAEVLLGGEGAREDQDAAGDLVEPLHHAERRPAADGVALAEDVAHQRVERHLVAGLVAEGHGADAGRLAHDHQARVEVDDEVAQLAAPARCAGGGRACARRACRRRAPCWLGSVTHSPADADLAGLDELRASDHGHLPSARSAPSRGRASQLRGDGPGAVGGRSSADVSSGPGGAHGGGTPGRSVCRWFGAVRQSRRNSRNVRRHRGPARRARNIRDVDTLRARARRYRYPSTRIRDQSAIP